MLMLRTAVAAALVTFLASAPSVARERATLPAQQSAQPFRFSTDDFWLNLHSFLYVLGRNESKTPDRTRRAVVNAPIEAERVLAAASDADRAAWARTVSFYASGPSKRDTVFD